MYPVDQIIGQPQINQYSPNTPVVQTLPREAILDEISVRVSGTLTLAGYSAAPTRLVEAEKNIIGLLQVAATGDIADVFKSCGFDWFCTQMQLLEGTAPYTTAIGTSNQAYPFETQGKVYFRGARYQQWQNTLLDARLLANLTVSLNWRDETAMVAGGTGGTATLSGVQAVLMAREWFGVTPASTPAFGHLRESEIISNIGATQDDFDVNTLPVGNLIRRIAFKGMVGANSFSDPSDSLFNTGRPANLKIKDGAVYPLSVGYLDLRARNKSFYNLEAFPSGLAVWEPSIHGTVAEQYDARGKRQLDALIDVTCNAGNTNTLAIRTVEHVLPVRK